MSRRGGRRPPHQATRRRFYPHAVGRADGRKRRCEQLLAHLVGRGENLSRSKMIALVIGLWRWSSKKPVARWQIKSKEQSSAQSPDQQTSTAPRFFLNFTNL